MARAGIVALGVAVGSGLVLLGSAPVSAAQGASACGSIEATLTSIQKQLPQAAASGNLATKIKSYVSELESEAAGATPAVRSAVNAFVADLEAAASGNIDVVKLTADANAIGTACSASAGAAAPVGAAATGGGGTSGLQDAWLLLGGSAAVVAGGAVLALELRRRHARAGS